MKFLVLLCVATIAVARPNKDGEESHPDARVTGTKAFSMFRTTDMGPVAQETVIDFNLIEADVGENIEFNSVYRAPLDGTYIISYTVYGVNAVVEVRRRRNLVASVVNTATIGDGNLDLGRKSTGGTFLLDLLAQDEIYMMLMPPDGRLHATANREISFSGFLLHQRIPTNEREIRATGTASFSMFRTTQLGPVSQNTVIPFNFIESNVGDVINALSTFIAPLDGTYIFSYTIYGNNVEVQLIRNRNSFPVVMNAVVAGDGDYVTEQVSTGSTVLLDLLVDDLVYLNLPGGATQALTGTTNREVSFSGFLLYQRHSP